MTVKTKKIPPASKSSEAMCRTVGSSVSGVESFSVAGSHRRRSRIAMGLLFATTMLLQSCYMVNWFQSDDGDSGSVNNTAAGIVLGQSLGDRAGGLEEAALTDVYAVATEYPPAAIRPDPDTFARNLLGQYRPPSVTLAREIGDIEPYRLLLGGASEDFSKVPQTEYDATSLLTVFALAEEACAALVAPTGWRHAGWDTILPNAASDESGNIQWLAQRIMGVPTAQIDQERLDALATILTTEEPFLGEENYGNHDYAKYVPVCVALLLDAEALFL